MLSARIGPILRSRQRVGMLQNKLSFGQAGSRPGYSFIPETATFRISSIATGNYSSTWRSFGLQEFDGGRAPVRYFTTDSQVSYALHATPQAPYNEKIKSLIENKKYEEALEVFEEMTSSSVAPEETTFSLLALAIAYMNPTASMEYLLKIKDQYLAITKPHIPIKPGKSILSRMAANLQTRVEAPRAPRATHAPKLDKYVTVEREEAANEPVSFFESQNYILSDIFRVWVDKRAPDVMVDFLLRHHTKPRAADITLALDQCIKYHKPEEGWKVYMKWRKHLPTPKVFHLAVVLNASQIQHDMSKAIISEKEALKRIQTVYQDMTDANQLQSYTTQAFLLRHWGQVSRHEYAFSLFKNMKEDPYIAQHLQMSDYNVILNLYAMTRMVKEAEEMWESMLHHPTLKVDAHFYNTMVKVYARIGDTARAWALVGEMVRHGTDPALYAKHRGLKQVENDLWPTPVTMSILLDMEARIHGPVALIETFEAIRNTYHLTPSLNNWGALIEQLAIQKQYIACFDWFVAMLRTQSLNVTIRECCYLTLLDASTAPFTAEQRNEISGISWKARNEAPPLTTNERRKWIATLYKWKDNYLRNQDLKPPPELDLEALQRIRNRLVDTPPDTTKDSTEATVAASQI